MLCDMRTTLNLDDDVLETVKAVAARDRKALGIVVSDMLRRAVEPPVEPPVEALRSVRNGIPLFPVSANAQVVTPEQIKKLLEDDE